jgi:energy-converting hydrogenase B subunit D
MIPLQVVALLLAAGGATAVVLTRDPSRQVVLTGLYGLALTVLFMVFQAPDVALSELVVGTVAAPLILLAAIRRARRRAE